MFSHLIEIKWTEQETQRYYLLFIGKYGLEQVKNGSKNHWGQKIWSHGLQLMTSTSLSSFSLEQKDICKYRLKLLQFLDRLSTYEVILGGVCVAHEDYSHEFFEKFRETNIVQAAVEYARVR